MSFRVRFDVLNLPFAGCCEFPSNAQEMNRTAAATSVFNVTIFVRTCNTNISLLYSTIIDYVIWSYLQLSSHGAFCNN